MALIRDGRAEDLEELKKLYRALYGELRGYGLVFALDEGGLEPSLRAALSSKLCFLAVAEEEGALVGFLSAGVVRMDRKLSYEGEKAMGLIHDLYLSPEVRGKGLAGALLDRAEEWMSAAGAGIVECQVVQGNALGEAFWSRRGYGAVSVTRAKGLRGDGHVVPAD